MALQMSERRAAAGAAAAAGIPVAMSALNVNLEQEIVDVANWIFEGDIGSASWVAGLGFTAIGALMVAAAWVGPLAGNEGMLAIGAGIGFIALAVQAFDVVRGGSN